MRAFWGVVFVVWDLTWDISEWAWNVWRRLWHRVMFWISGKLTRPSRGTEGGKDNG